MKKMAVKGNGRTTGAEILDGDGTAARSPISNVVRKRRGMQRRANTTDI
ncbi:hypothetical protein [Caballeronia sp. LjRoot31]